MNKEDALKLLHANMDNVNLRRHCYAVGIALVAIRQYLEKNKMLDENSPTEEEWEILGILHDSDYEITKDDWEQHTLITLKWLKESGMEEEHSIYKAIESHNAKRTGLRPPETQMEWALECCDELTGFIVACALILPDKKISNLTAQSVKKKWKQPAFARNVHREQIEQCQEKLKIPLDEFIGIVLDVMKQNAGTLAL